jgi:hypothetical protein
MEASQKIAEYIQKNQDWKGELIHQVRELILQTDSTIEEEWKWNSPVWSKNGIVCSISAFKKHVSLTFFKGSEIEKETILFNNPSDSKNTRSIIWKEGDEIKNEQLKELIKIAILKNNEK